MRVNFAPTLSIPILIRFTSFVSRISISNAISKLQLCTKSAMPHKTYILIIVPSYIFLYRYEYSPPANCNIKKSASLTCNNQKGFFFHLAHLTSFILKLCFLPFFYSVSESISDFKAYSVFRSIPMFDLGLFYFQAYHSKFSPDWTYFIFVLQIRC